MSEHKPRVALFVTCLVDLYRPNVGFSAIELLERAGCTVVVPPAQTAAASRPTTAATGAPRRTSPGR
jgi:Fe-S oxidoreductase